MGPPPAVEALAALPGDRPEAPLRPVAELALRHERMFLSPEDRLAVELIAAAAEATDALASAGGAASVGGPGGPLAQGAAWGRDTAMRCPHAGQFLPSLA